VTVDLLPINGATLASDPAVLNAVRGISRQYGLDYTDDTTVTHMLAERRRAAEATQRGWAVWVGGLAMVACVAWPFAAQTVPSVAEKPASAYGPVGPLLVIAVGALTAVRTRWKRELTRPALVGYRHVLGVARAHGLPLTHIPAWLEGKSYGGTGKGAVPVPTYPGPPEPPVFRPIAEVPAPPAAPVAVPSKPPGVRAYEEIVDEGGWHDEAGCLVLLAALIGAGYAWAEGMPAGYVALALIPVAIWIWVAGSRQGAAKEALRQEALAYVRAVAVAQAAGARVPELSPVLRRLLDDDPQTLR
jgi:hypothetical protein